MFYTNLQDKNHSSHDKNLNITQILFSHKFSDKKN